MATTETTGKRTHSLFVTVGSTKFIGLIDTVLSRDFVQQIASSASPNDVKIVVQYGATPLADILTSPSTALVHEVQADGVHVVSTGIRSSISKPELTSEDGEGQVEDAVSLDSMANLLRPEMISKQGERSSSDGKKLLRFQIPSLGSRNAVSIELVDYVSDITPFLHSADIVVSHAGSGTILETLRLDVAKKPVLVVVPNETLMDNHQTELALALAEKNHVIATRVNESNNRLSALISTLLSSDDSQKPRIQPFPPAVPGRFRSLVDTEMGFF